MANYVSEDQIRKGLETAIRANVAEAMESIIGEAKKKVEVELKKKTDSIALFLLSEYSVYRDGRDVIIRVKSDATPAEQKE